jgi:diguanylate cyclase (GGDEF)-like protein
MNRSIPAFAVIPLAIVTIATALGCASTAWCAPPAPLTSLHTIHALSHADAARRLPVAFEATVTYYRGRENMMFVQDDGVGIYVHAPMDAGLVPGDRVLIKGAAADSFGVYVISDTVSLLQHGAVPRPIPADFDELIHVERDCLLITVRGVIRAADPAAGADGPTFVELLTDGGYISAIVDNDDASARRQLLDADVEITGIASANLDGKWQETGVRLYVPSLAYIKVLARASASPLSLPVTPMDKIFMRFQDHQLTPRTRVRGTITYFEPGSAVVLENGNKSLWIETHGNAPLRVGDLADATGFPTLHDGFLALARAEIQDSAAQAPIAPELFNYADLSSSHHIFDLVSIEGQVVTEIREASQDEYVLASGGDLFTAIYRHSQAASPDQLSPMKMIAPGARVRVTGICMLKNSNPYNGPVPFDILLRSFDDIAVVGRASWLNVRNLILLVGLLVLIVFAVGARAWAIERKVRRHSAATAYIERRRGRILEDINGSRALAEIIDQITELVSFQLKGAPCWCQVTGGALFGNCPENPSVLRVLHHKIPARSGPPLGQLSASFDPLAKPSGIEAQTLSMAAELARLAIETRRLYSDLLRRSEFDLLTDINNRFSFDKRLDVQINEARLNAGIFGLIYIDLDGFKQVNDMHGQLVGDMYLREVADRMKDQLRPTDTLARLGGDEFAALLPEVRSRADVQEAAQRLNRCFDEPFAIEGIVIKGSASVGVALYPQDGATKDSLLSAADAAMYARKHAQRV